jgi:hypothetical protein
MARSLRFRRRLTEGLPDLEASLTVFLLQQPDEQAAVDGYRLALVEGRVEIEEAPVIDNLYQHVLPGIFEESECCLAATQEI